MGIFILLLFIFFIVVPLVRFGWRIWVVSRQFKQAQQRMNDMFNNARQAQSSGYESAGKTRKKKKINPEDGEFVQFEELDSSTDTPDPQSFKTKSSGSVKPESQIEDAVWEDIK